MTIIIHLILWSSTLSLSVFLSPADRHGLTSHLLLTLQRLRENHQSMNHQTQPVRYRLKPGPATPALSLSSQRCKPRGRDQSCIIHLCRVFRKTSGDDGDVCRIHKALVGHVSGTIWWPMNCITHIITNDIGSQKKLYKDGTHPAFYYCCNLTRVMQQDFNSFLWDLHKVWGQLIYYLIIARVQ